MRLLLCLLTALALCAPAHAEDRADAVIRKWNRYRREDLRERLEAAQEVAELGTAAALDILVDEFATTKDRDDKLLELLAPSFATAFSGAEFDEKLRAAFTTSLSKPEHAWLVHHLGLEWCRQGHRDRAMQWMDGVCIKLPFHRAALLRAMSATSDPLVLSIARDALWQPPEAALDRQLLWGAAMAVVERNLPEADKKDVPALVEPFISLLERPETGPRAKRVTCRALARMLHTELVYGDATSWRVALDQREAAAKAAKDGYGPGGHAYFFGLSLSGRDVVFVIDTSGSMTAPFTRRPARGGGGAAGPTSGTDPKPPGRSPRDTGSKPVPGLDDLPWDRIKTRMDAVKEGLELCLLSLDEKQRFAVVGFSTDGRWVQDRMVYATKQNVARAIGIIRKMEPDGATNIHRALEMAFGAHEDGHVDRCAGVAPESLASGADTVVLLTDGEPTTDSYSGAAQAMNVRGVYCASQRITTALRRWLLFSDAEVNCIAMGKDCNLGLLRELADTGGGKMLVVDD